MIGSWLLSFARHESEFIMKKVKIINSGIKSLKYLKQEYYDKYAETD